MKDHTRDEHGPARTLAAAVAIVALAAAFVSIHTAGALAIGTSFTYQGQLKKNSAPYTGSADFTFRLFTAASGGVLLGTQNQTGVPVTAGLFTTQIDFGSAFDGTARWLEIAASTPGDGPTTLTPRQEIKSVPYALRSTFAESGNTGSQWLNAASGIHYLGGNVAIGLSADTYPDRRFIVDTGTANANAGWFKSNNPNYATLAIQNESANGIGLADLWSAQHWVTGRVGVGTTSTVSAQLTVVPTTTSVGIMATGYGSASSTAAVWGIGDGNIFVGPCTGVIGQSDVGNGVEGYAQNASYYGGYFRNVAGGTALFSDGLAQVRTLQILGGADLVEGFDVRDDARSDERPEPGSVLVIDAENPGRLRSSTTAYDQKVAGVVSGAGGVSPGIRLGQDGVLDGQTDVAMTGRVYVKCTTENGPIRAGDRLTTSSRTGHAMRATNASLSDGAVIGKAMTALDSGTGLVLVLVNLQ